MHLATAALGMLLAAVAAVFIFHRDTGPTESNPRGAVTEEVNVANVPGGAALPKISADNNDATDHPGSGTTGASLSTGMRDWLTGWGEPVNLGPAVNTKAKEAGPELSGDGLTLYFYSDRTGGLGGDDLWMCTRRSLSSPFTEPLNLGAPVNSTAREARPAVTADGLTLLFNSDRAGGYGTNDLWMCQRKSTNDAFSEPINVGAQINTADDELSPAISKDGLTLLFHSSRAGGRGDADLWTCKRNSVRESFSKAIKLEAPVNSTSDDGGPSLASP